MPRADWAWPESKHLPLSYDKYARRGAVFGPEPAYVLGTCTPTTPARSRRGRSGAANATP